jgi:hypothetical protein
VTDQSSDPVDSGDPTTDSVELHLTAAQQRRYRRGLVAVAAMVWSAGLVRFTLVDRLAHVSGWLALLVLAVLLLAVAWALSSVQPVTGLDSQGVGWRWGPRQRRVRWSEITGVEVRDRGMARQVLLVRADDRLRLPVPLTGGSLLGPGPDPDLDTKVDLIHRWWVAHQPA